MCFWKTVPVDQDKLCEQIEKNWAAGKLDKALNAVKKLDDPKILVKLVTGPTHGNPALAIAAVEQLTDAQILENIVHMATSGDVARAAALALRDQERLANIAADWQGVHVSVRPSAIRNLTNKAVLRSIAEDDPYDDIKMVAKARLREL